MKTKAFRNNILEIHYREEGPSEGEPVLFLHDLPDDATSFSQVQGSLSGKGFRTIAPFCRGVGPTNFTYPDTPRAADFAALAQDALDLIDGLDLKNLTVVGQGMGSGVGEVCAFMRPDRVKKLVKLNWYGLYSLAERGKTASFNYDQLKSLWFAWFMNTPGGEAALNLDPFVFIDRIWEECSPTWDKSARTEALRSIEDSFRNFDFAKIVVNAYRSGLTEAPLDPRNNSLRDVLKNPPPVPCPAILMRGKADGVERVALSSEGIQTHFLKGIEIVELPGVGHFLQREAPVDVVVAVLKDR